MKTNLRKCLLGVLISIAVLAIQVVPVLADEGTGGTANVLDYAVTTVVVPTSFKIALNPNQYSITTKYVKTSDEVIADGKTYYTLAEGVYSAVASPSADDLGSYYEAVKSTAQIVSLNYGIANKSTAAQDVTVDIKATYTATDSKTAITFVDSAEKAQAYNETSNPNGAKKNELKMYLAVASAAPAESGDAVTAATYKKATAYSEDKQYYTKSEGAFSAADVADVDAFDAGTFYEETTTIGPEILGTQLADVNMTPATGASVQAFAAGTTDKANASVAYKLDEATYSLKDGEIIDFNTTQAQLADKLEMSDIGGIAAFTLVGSINADADWTQADTASIVFTPTYGWDESDGTETLVEGGYNQIAIEEVITEAAPSIATTGYTFTAGNPVAVTVSLGAGDLAATGITSITYLSPSGSVKTLNADNYSLEGNTLTFSSAYVDGLISSSISSRDHTITFNDSATTAVTVTFNAE